MRSALSLPSFKGPMPPNGCLFCPKNSMMPCIPKYYRAATTTAALPTHWRAHGDSLNSPVAYSSASAPRHSGHARSSSSFSPLVGRSHGPPASSRQSMLWSAAPDRFLRFFSPLRSYSQQPSAEPVDLSRFTPDLVRNFCIISHIDHGKTTMSSSLMRHTGTLKPLGSESKEQQVVYLDKLQVERERGITVKAQTASLIHRYQGKEYLLNLIDTPGHVDFTYEVSRSMAACQGAILLVDATQGVQAQTMANFFLAFNANLHIIPVLNKIDLPTANIPASTQELCNMGFEESEILHASGKSGIGLNEILEAIVLRIPSPQNNAKNPFRALLFDSWFDSYFGVICLIKVVDGQLKKGDRIVAASTNQSYEVEQLGFLYPERTITNGLYTGQVGWVIPAMKTTAEARVGDTFHLEGKPVERLPGFKPAKQMVFAGLYPSDGESVEKLRDAVEKLVLTDAGTSYQRENSDALGMGYRCGFLGLLHMEVFLERLEQEYNMTVIATAPTVPFEITTKEGETMLISKPSDFPDESDLLSCREPVVEARIITPMNHMAGVLKLCMDRRGEQKELSYIAENRVFLKYTIPLMEIISDFNDKLKSITSGYATLDYEESGYIESDLVKLKVLINAKEVEALAMIAPKEKAFVEGKSLTLRLKNVLKRQMFMLSIQVAVGNKVLARETLAAFRKDVTAKCYGGDITRKRKLLEKQKEGKKRMKTVGNVELSQEAFYSVLKKD
ncbi:Translation factor GUF1, mitochondrial [Balamuthia mandrillaris]